MPCCEPLVLPSVRSDAVKLVDWLVDWSSLCLLVPKSVMSQPPHVVVSFCCTGKTNAFSVCKPQRNTVGRCVQYRESRRSACVCGFVTFRFSSLAVAPIASGDGTCGRGRSPGTRGRPSAPIFPLRFIFGYSSFFLICDTA